MSETKKELTPEERALLPGPLDGGDAAAARYFAGIAGAVADSVAANPQVVAESLAVPAPEKPAKKSPAAPAPTGGQ